MQSTLVRFVCRILIASMMVLPFQARAGLIGTEQAVSAAQAQVARATVDAYIERSEVLQQLLAHGLSPQEAQARVSALSDAEISALAGRIDSLPTGGGAWIPLLIAAILVIWLLLDRSKEEAAAKKPAPAPEKK